ncbi:hypothetical protein M378DRAFT_92022 [Amanita muscaria Koide BX008]|uniref:Uncharacterized protein n=1 Tax=Amanita muscaria (strain Koide BX008) TaxID=946122 RepID=A0A0C2WF36_AMAMK|nr:hypothetical protein M378DRAFT_92022 [Amanita muscaria Koide BX008]
MTTHERQRYSGTETKLVIAIDVGTTFSGVSFALLDPGVVPQIQPVTQFIGQREARTDSKVPSIVCYSQNGTVVAAGAETDPNANHTLAEMDDFIRVEWFKLHLRPPHLAPSQEFELQKLRSFPKNKTPVQVFGDLLRYLFQSTKKYITDSELCSWDSVERNIYFIFSHPNGWEGKQQSQMRKAAIAGDLIDKSQALERISFVSEGEASLHFCLNKKPTLHNECDGILVVDCGGGTIDVSAYSQTIKGTFKELTQPECLFQGSIFVTCRAKEYFKRKLQDSKYGSDEIEDITSEFDRITKCTFNTPDTPSYVKFRGLKHNDPEFDIRSGRIKIIGTQISSFFKPALQDIIRVIDRQRSKTTVNVKTVLLVGGFARSDYLFSQLSSYFNGRSVSIVRADIMHLNKAVADGAVSYYLDHYVTARVSKNSYGVEISALSDFTDPEHARRRNTKVMQPDGRYYIPGGFSTILKNGTTVNEETEFRKSYSVLLTPAEFTRWAKDSTFLMCYRGKAESPPEWIDLEPDSFHGTCVIKADTTNVKDSMSLNYNTLTEKTYYHFAHDVVILFGLTELKAYVTWKENVRDRISSKKDGG